MPFKKLEFSAPLFNCLYAQFPRAIIPNTSIQCSRSPKSPESEYVKVLELKYHGTVKPLISGLVAIYNP